MDSFFKLVLICGLVITEMLSGATGHLIRKEMDAVLAVQKYYKLKGNEWAGAAVFTPYLDKVETCTCEKLVFAAMLNSYLDIFSDMLKKSKADPEGPEAELSELQERVNHLRKNKYSKEQSVLKQLQEIRLLNVKNFTVQGGAVNDFLSVFDMASKGFTVALPDQVSAEEKLKPRSRKTKLRKQENARLKAKGTSGKQPWRRTSQRKRHSRKCRQRNVELKKHSRKKHQLKANPI